MSFWEKSTDKQKLAQIDGGIECRLTIRQIAMNCGTTRAALSHFARKHGRTFPTQSPSTSYSMKSSARRGGRVAAIIAARTARVPNVLMNDAFSIFGVGADREPAIFDFGGDR
ncbi:hypothetical protein PH552_12170 [Rhizobium sp. CNPSo 3968]|uniref:hypothetical protein n=1 Tax=Rhizobium sp. CNPSo 3968 TaxID=3021408 RepID=UPI00254B92EE|nr:hypothetical protein [Rhizobium sp. CNPSo 3968]MDK4720100.1 hypothetical protein [Rhizobium sp. CNPSo 3968]